MKAPLTNIKKVKGSRRKPEAGDLFCYQLDPIENRYFFGRVVATDTTIGGFRDIEVNLIYLYREGAPTKEPPTLRVEDLLIPPLGTNDQPWKQGFFEFVKSATPGPGDVLPHHCFQDSGGKFFDEYGVPMSSAVEPVGWYALAGIGSIDDKVSKALGVTPKQ